MASTTVPNIGATAPAREADAAQRKKPSPLRSILAGSTAGAVEIAITYPAEFMKVRVVIPYLREDTQQWTRIW